MKTYFSLCVLAFTALSCAPLSDEELWMKVEAAKANGNWDSTMNVCRRILAEYPDGRYASWARFGLAESHRFLNQPREALDNYKLFYEQNPAMQPSALSLFLVGYIYNNSLHRGDSAKYYYERFLRAFPEHDLAPTVRFELETLGLSPQEALIRKQSERTLTRK